MREYLDATSLANAVRMRRSARNCLFLLVEGKDDRLALEPLVNTASCDIVSGNGKATVIGAMQRLVPTVSKSPSGLAVVALVDRDYDDKLVAMFPDGVVVTDLCDREVDSLVPGGLLHKYALTWVDLEEAKLPIIGNPVAALEEMLVGAANSIGILRRVSRGLSQGLNLGKFPVSDVILQDLSVDIELMVQVAADRTKNCPHAASDIMREYSLERDSLSASTVCNGHDLVSVVSSTSKWWSVKKRTRRDVENFVIENTSIEVLSSLLWSSELESRARDWGFSIWSSDLGRGLICSTNSIHCVGARRLVY